MKSQQNVSNKTELPVVMRLADTSIDGPQPMKNLKPGGKSHNAADQFWCDHQEEHEKRAATPDSVDIQKYNKVPKLEENLTKMAALSKMKASATIVAKNSKEKHTHKSRENICQQCYKQRMIERKKRHKTSHSDRIKKPDLKSRVKKSNYRRKNITKSRIPKSRYSLVGRGKKNCNCRDCMRVTNKGTCTNLVLKEASTLTHVIYQNENAKRASAETDSSNNLAGSAKSDYTNNNSRHNSMHSTSYKSNLSHLSLDHEPMVTN